MSKKSEYSLNNAMIFTKCYGVSESETNFCLSVNKESSTEEAVPTLKVRKSLLG